MNGGRFGRGRAFTLLGLFETLSAGKMTAFAGWACVDAHILSTL